MDLDKADLSWVEIQRILYNADAIVKGIRSYQYYCQENYIDFDNINACEETLKEEGIIDDFK